MQSDAAGGAQRAVFLDRDGTINREVDYLARVEDFAFLPGAIEALAALSEAGYLLVVVTNQSGIARGLLNEARLDEIHAHMSAVLQAAGVSLDWIGYCPHHPDHGEGRFRASCSCRKPKPGLFLSAAADLNVDLEGSFCVGDSMRDLKAAAEVGVAGLLVRTGKGEAEEQRSRGSRNPPTVVDDLGAAARYILGHDDR